MSLPPPPRAANAGAGSGSGGAAKTPHWLYRIEHDETSTILRASSQYAQRGFDPTLHLKKQTAVAASQAHHRDRSGSPTGGGRGGRGRRGFENSTLTRVPTQYVNTTTGRSLTTEKPFSRPSTSAQQRPPSTAGPELLGAVSLRRAAAEAKGETVTDKRLLLAPSLGGGGHGRGARPDHSDAALDAALGLSPRRHGGPAVEPSRVPLSKLKGVVHHPVGSQLVDRQLWEEAHADPHATLAAATRRGGADDANFADAPDRERMELPRASDVLKRYKMFTVRPDAPQGRNLDALMNPSSLHTDAAALNLPPGVLVADGRARLARSGTTAAVGPPADAVAARLLPAGATSHAILQNRMGSTVMGGEPLPRGGSGLVVGDLLVGHDALTPATLVAAKWGRIAKTTYGKAPGEPCRLRCEMQPLYYESFIADMGRILPGAFDFTPDVQPAVFVVDIGSVNAAVHGYRASNVPPPEIGDGPEGVQEADEAGGGESADDGDGGGGSSSSPRKGGGSRFGLTDVASAKKGGGPLVEDDMRARRARLKKKKKQKTASVPSQADVRRAELRMAMDAGKEKANELLIALARDGSDAALERLVSRGYKIDYNPSPWYVQMAEKTDKRRAEARARTFVEDGAGRGGGGGGGGGEVGAAETTGPPPPGRSTVGYSGAAADADGGDADGGGAPSASKKKAPEIFVLPDINFVDPNGDTALMHAARNGWIDCAMLLLRFGADHYRKNDRGQTAFDLARAESNTASVALHIHIPGAAERKRRAAKLAQMLDDRTVLVCAQKGDLRRLQYLVDDCGHPVNAVNVYGMTPLHFAVIRKDLGMMDYLSERGADVNARNNLGQTPLSLILDMPSTEKNLQARLLAALKSGDRTRAEAAAAKANAAADAAQAAEHERHLIRALKTATKGTTAAKAVHLGLSHVHDPSFCPPPGTVLPPSDPMGYHSRPSAALTAAVGGGGHGGHDGHAPYGHTSSAPSADPSLLPAPRPIPTAMKQEAMKTAGALAESWNRHVLNFMALQQKEARIRDAQRSIAAREVADDVEAARRRFAATANASRRGGPEASAAAAGGAGHEDLGFGGGSHHHHMGGRGGPLVALPPLPAPAQAATAAALGAATARDVSSAMQRGLSDPGTLQRAEVELRRAPIPAADSQKFEAWARMRFGAL
jgi:ankyrin repeat protein